MTGNIQMQLQQILEKEAMWDSIQSMKEKHRGPSVCDISDGESYQALREECQLLRNKDGISFTMFTDGIPLFSSSNTSLWPVYLLINEIPPAQRFHRRNMILWGI